MARVGSLQVRVPVCPVAAPAFKTNHLWRRLGQNELTMSGGLILAGRCFAAIFAPVLGPFGPPEMNPPHLLEAPSISHWLGTDEFGRDILSRVIWGAGIS